MVGLGGNVSPYDEHPRDRIHQGDIIKDLPVVVETSLRSGQGEPNAEIATREFAVVITQECDLEQDHKLRQGEAGESTHDKALVETLLAVAVAVGRRLSFGERLIRMPSVLLASAIDAMRARQMKLTSKRPWFNRDEWSRVVQNKNERYQILEPDPPRHRGLLVDFKQVFTVSTEYLYCVLEQAPALFLSSMSVPYREQVSSRFAYFVSRIALPRDHDDPADQRFAPVQLPEPNGEER